MFNKSKVLISINIIIDEDNGIKIMWRKKKEKFPAYHQAMYHPLILSLIIFNKRWKNYKFYWIESKDKSSLILTFVSKWRS